VHLRVRGVLRPRAWVYLHRLLPAEYPGPMSSECTFCEIAAGRAPATIERSDADYLAIVPLNPVVEGHLLVLPRVHVTDASIDPEVTAGTMRFAARVLPWGDSNIITSVGPYASQTVLHLHVHIVPRRMGDGLHLPWTPL
jgi:histidine triad (HIT) family protein